MIVKNDQIEHIVIRHFFVLVSDLLKEGDAPGRGRVIEDAGPGRETEGQEGLGHVNVRRSGCRGRRNEKEEEKVFHLSRTIM